MYLVDTNVWLERLLNQERSEEVGRFLGLIASENLYITDFSFHSVGVILCRLGKPQVFTQFMQDAFVEGAVSLVRLEPVDFLTLVEIMEQFGLDFDDAYQYAATEKYQLMLVSLDKDFDRTTRGRLKPGEIS